LFEANDPAGISLGQYFFQDLWVARRIFEANPGRHIDVGSRIDGFVAHVASFRDIDIIDYRPLVSGASGIHFIQGDMMQELPPDLLGATDSLSCLHALEHFGLGRYGDPICHDGHRRGLANLARILRPGGTLYLSVPIGEQRTEFNAHRVFSVCHLLDLVGADFVVIAVSFVDDAGQFHPNVDLQRDMNTTSFGCQCGCAILELRRRYEQCGR